MKLLKKSLAAVYYLAMVLLAVWAISSDAFNSLLGNLATSDGGILVKVAAYFKHADTWNLIFFFMFFAAAIGLLMLFNLLTDRLFKAMVRRYPKLSFLNSEWSDWTLQKGGALAAIVFLFWATANVLVPWQAGKHIVQSASEIPRPMPVLVLGTSKMLTNGKGENKYYTYRIEAAVELFRQGKAKFFILSGDGGDGRKDGYDETRDMKDDLIANGVPEAMVKIDTAGFRTLDSILRLRVLFKMNEIIIVSQGFHQPRSIFLSLFYGIDPYGFPAKGSATWAMVKREAFSSRPGLLMDLIFANMQPRVLNGAEAYKFREDFEAKSNLHVLILLGLFVLVFVMVMGFGVYQSKEGEERQKAVKKYVYGGSAIFATLVVMITAVYKNLDIKFVDELVESVAQVVAVKTEKMEVKEVRQEQARIVFEKTTEKQREIELAAALAEQQNQRIADSLAHLPIETVKPVVPKEPEKLNVVTVSTTPTAVIKKDSALNVISIVDKPVEQPVKRRSLNIVSAGTTTGSNDNNLQLFQVQVHNTQVIENDKQIFLRTSERIVVKGKSIPEHTVFAARANVFNGKIMFFVENIDDLPVAMKSYSADKKEGISILDRFYQGGKLVLSDGESLYLNKM